MGNPATLLESIYKKHHSLRDRRLLLLVCGHQSRLVYISRMRTGPTPVYGEVGLEFGGPTWSGVYIALLWIF